MKFILVVIAVLLNFAASAQHIRDTEAENLSSKELVKLKADRIQRSLDKIGLKLTWPFGFFEMKKKLYDSDFGSMDYAITNKDSSALIAIAFQPRDSISYVRELRAILLASPERTDFDPNDQWLVNFKVYADTVDSKPTYYDKSKLGKYNADEGGDFEMKKGRLFFGNYSLQRAVMFNKKYRGFVTILYLAKTGSNVNMEKYIKNGDKMIRYKSYSK